MSDTELQVHLLERLTSIDDRLRAVENKLSRYMGWFSGVTGIGGVIIAILGIVF